MLVSLKIENFALIDVLDLSLGPGLNVLTGETGAGKSIILDAIDAVLGGRLSRHSLRSGESRATLEAMFQLSSPLGDWFIHHSIPPRPDLTLACHRELILQGGNVRSRSRINGVPVKREQLAELRDRLVEITAQGQAVQLGQAGRQREWLDQFGGDALLHQRQEVAQRYESYQQARQALEKRRRLENERLQQLDVFEYQARELADAQLSDPQELHHLEQESQRLHHVVELQRQSYEVFQILYDHDDGQSSTDLLGQAEATLIEMVHYDDQLQDILDLVSSALAQVKEAGQQINTYGAALETDPERLTEVEQRLQILKQICRKYGPTLAEAIAHEQRLHQDLLQLNGQGQSLEALEAEVQAQGQALHQACDRLRQQRQTAAAALENRLVAELKPLAMDKVKFHVALQPLAPTPFGTEQVTFEFSPNPGEPLQPLTATASGGEMSRFLLALKACFTQGEGPTTLVFDEIDVGVSGRVAQAIATKLHQLSRHHQVLCVTHQPLVAAMADHHFHVRKQVIGGETPAIAPPHRGRRKSAAPPAPPPGVDPSLRTVIRVESLDLDQRREELAQLAGGNSAQEASTFAEALLHQAQVLRQQSS